MQRFAATLSPVPGGGNYVVVPPEVCEAAKLAYGARVRGTLNGIAYRSSLMKYSGVYHLGVHKATIAAAGAAAGDTVEVALELDDKPLPTDTVPKDLARAIAASPKAKIGWKALAPSHRREHVKHVLDAKKAETRERRIKATVAALAKPKPKPKSR